MFEFGRICEAGSSIIRTDGSLSAIALPGVSLGSLMCQNVADAAYASFIAVVILGTLGILSVYLPDG